MRVITRRCGCSRMMLDKDPHTCCKNCRPPCDVTVRCEACVNLSSDDFADLNKGYLKMAVRRIAQTRVRRKRRTSKDDTMTRLRALESVLQLQSTRGTNLETLLLAEGLPTLPETSGRPSSSTGTFTTFGSSRAAVVGEISYSDSVADDAVRTVPPSPERESTSQKTLAARCQHRRHRRWQQAGCCLW